MKPEPPNTVAIVRCVCARMEGAPREAGRGDHMAAPVAAPIGRPGGRAAMRSWPDRLTPKDRAYTCARSGAVSRGAAMPHRCPGGGIGRRAGFRYLWPRG